MRKIILLTLLLFSLMLSYGSAEERKEEWNDKGFPFANLKTVAVSFSVAEGVKLEEIEQKKIADMSEAIFSANSGTTTQWLNEKQILKRIGVMTQVELDGIKKSEPEKYQAAWDEQVLKVSEAKLDIKIRQWGYTQQYVPDTIENYTEYQNTPVSVVQYDSNGRPYTTIQWVQVPIERSRIIPAHYEPIAHAGAECTLTNNKTGAKIWMLIDLRDAKGDKVPSEMMERILRRALERFIALQK